MAPPSGAEQACQTPGEVRNQAVHSEGEQALHLSDLVDGPDVEWDLVIVAMGDQEVGDEFSACEVRGNLECLDLCGRGPSLHGRVHHGDYVGDRGARGHDDASLDQRVSQPLHDFHVPRGEQGSIGPVELGYQIHHLSDGLVGGCLDLEIEARLRKCSEGILEARHVDSLAAECAFVDDPGRATLFDRAGVASIEFLEFGPGHGADWPASIRGALHVRVVHQDGNPVGGDLYVALDGVRSLLEAAGEGEKGVLWCASRGAPMPEDHRTLDHEVGMGHRRYDNMPREMAVLTRDVILREIESGRLGIDPFVASRVGVASVDLTLGDKIREIESGDEPLEVREETDFRDHTRVRTLDKGFVLDPGVTIHGLTRERVSLPPDICGFLEGRSRFARLGLMVHVTSAFVQPGVRNRQVLEMSNVSSRSLRIHAGVALCQLVLMRTDGEAVYAGRFADQDEI